MTPINKMQEAIERFREAKHNMEAAELDCADAQDQLIHVMGDQKTSTTTVDGYRVTVTKVEAVVLVTEEDPLKKRLGARLWDRVTVKKLDKSKLEDAIARGEVDPTVVAQCSKEVPRKPYVKLTEKKLLINPKRKVRKPPTALDTGF